MREAAQQELETAHFAIREFRAAHPWLFPIGLGGLRSLFQPRRRRASRRHGSCHGRSRHATKKGLATRLPRNVEAPPAPSPQRTGRQQPYEIGEFGRPRGNLPGCALNKRRSKHPCAQKPPLPSGPASGLLHSYPRSGGFPRAAVVRTAPASRATTSRRSGSVRTGIRSGVMPQSPRWGFSSCWS